MKKFFKYQIFLLGFISFLFLSPIRTFCFAGSYDPLYCPEGYTSNDELPPTKCINDSDSSDVINVPTRTEAGTYKQVPYASYCNSGDLFSGVCYTPGSKFTATDDDSFFMKDADFKFIKCKETNQYGFCKDSQAIVINTDDECYCSDGEVHDMDSYSNCDDACAAFGGVGVTSSAEDATNPPVTCTTRSGEEGVLTGLGCIPTTTTGLANWAILFGSIIGGVIATFKIIQGSVMVMTSSGNPDKLQEGKSVITSSLVGLVVIISAVLLLNFFGFDVLGLGSFGFNLD